MNCPSCGSKMEGKRSGGEIIDMEYTCPKGCGQFITFYFDA